MLTVARLEPHKGIDTALQALARLPPAYANVGYLVAGEGPHRATLEQLARDVGVGERVRFLGWVPERELPALYNVATVYVGASRQIGRSGVEGFGLAIAEAAASGLPIVATESGGIPDLVQGGMTGWLVPPDDPDGLAAALEGVLANEPAARQRGQAARRRVEEYLNWDRMTAELERITHRRPPPAGR